LFFFFSCFRFFLFFLFFLFLPLWNRQRKARSFLFPSLFSRRPFFFCYEKGGRFLSFPPSAPPPLNSHARQEQGHLRPSSRKFFSVIEDVAMPSPPLLSRLDLKQQTAICALFFFYFSTPRRREEGLDFPPRPFCGCSKEDYGPFLYALDAFPSLRTESAIRTLSLPPPLLSSLFPRDGGRGIARVVLPFLCPYVFRRSISTEPFSFPPGLLLSASIANKHLAFFRFQILLREKYLEEKRDLLRPPPPHGC